jgi:RimJ/RimL family protein N-acetyltransferase
MLRVIGKNIFLREFIEADIEDYIEWYTSCTEWMLWDAPWENEDNEVFDEELFRQQKRTLLENPNKKIIRSRLEICINNEAKTHIGWVSRYTINDNYHYTDEEEGKCAIGINLPDRNHRSKGYGKDAFVLFIQYLKFKGIQDIYTQTWSGNLRMIRLAERLGFEECNRYRDYRMVRGKTYDGLTFKLTK